MAVAITGSKYSAILTSVGTTTVTAAASSFSSSDFTTTARRADLFTSGGALKGHAFVRQCLSGTQLELETTFLDWKTGAAATQVTGDLLLISKNWAEVATTGIAVNGKLVTLSDEIIFGTDNLVMSLSFHDEGVAINHTQNGQFYKQVQFAGGTVSWGHLQSWVDKTTHSPCSYSVNSTPGTVGNFATFSSNAGAFCMFGGSVSVQAYFGSGWTGTPLGGDARLMWMLQVSLEDLNVLSKNAGGNWDDGTNHILESCSFVGGSQYLIMLRWANGLVIGGLFKVLRNSDLVISIFGSDAGGTFPIGAPADSRSIVADMGGPTVSFWRASSAATQAVVATNVISTNFDLVADPGNTANPNASLLHYFSDTYTNVLAGSVGVISLASDGSTVASSAATATSWAPSVLYDSYTGKTRNAGYPKTAWNYGIKNYGSNPVSGAIAPAAYPLGTAGTANNVSFGGLVNQIADTSVTLSLAAANALTSVVTLSNLMDVAKAWSVASVINAKYPTLGTYLVNDDGKKLDFGARNIVVDPTAGAVFSVNTGTNTITIKATTLAADAKFDSIVTTGTIGFVNGGSVGLLSYQDSTGSTTLLTVTSLTAAYVYVGNNSNVQQAYATNQTGTYQFLIPASGAGTWRVVVDRAGYTRKVFAPVANGVSQSFDGSLVQPIDFSGNPLYQGQSTALVTVTPNSPAAGNYRIDVGDGIATASEIYDAVENLLITAAGMATANLAVDFLPTSNGVYLALGAYVKLRRRSAGDNNSGVNAIVSQASGMPIDGANGPVAIQAASTQLTAQQIRNSLALDLSIGVVPTSGSVDGQLAKIKLDTGAVGALL